MASWWAVFFYRRLRRNIAHGCGHRTNTRDALLPSAMRRHGRLRWRRSPRAGGGPGMGNHRCKGSASPLERLVRGTGVTMTDNVAIWVSCGSVLVSFASVVIALMAKRQARQAALLMSRAEAIANLRHALGDLNRDGLASTKTMDRIQNALNLSHLVFSKAVRKNVEQHTFLRA